MRHELIDYDMESKEASIEFSKEDNAIITYCPYLENPKLKNEYELTAFLPNNITSSSDEESIIKDSSGYYSYRITAKLVERINNFCKVNVKGLIISIDNVPNDIKIGENIQFSAIRIDYNQL